MLEILLKVILLSVLWYSFIFIIGTIGYIIQFINPEFRKNYYANKNICKQIKETGNLDLMKNISTNKPSDNIYKFHYENVNRFINDDIYNSKYEMQRQEFIKIIGILNKYSIESKLTIALKEGKNIEENLKNYLITEITDIYTDLKNKELNDEIRILKSKKRYIDFLIKKELIGDIEYLKTALNNIKI